MRSGLRSWATLPTLAERCQSRPNQRARRLEPKCSFSATSSADGALKRAGRLRAGEEVDVDAADPAVRRTRCSRSRCPS